MAEIHAMRTCDICGRIVAWKKYLIFKTERVYIKIRFHGDRSNYFLCQNCYREVSTALKKRLEGEAEE